jgi:hypothetical protein
VIICAYRVPTLPGTSHIYGGLQTHPVFMILGDFQQNPHYRHKNGRKMATKSPEPWGERPLVCIHQVASEQGFEP